MQEEYESYIFVADLHALTLPIEPSDLYANSRDIAAYYLAADYSLPAYYLALRGCQGQREGRRAH